MLSRLSVHAVGATSPLAMSPTNGTIRRPARSRASYLLRRPLAVALWAAALAAPLTAQTTAALTLATDTFERGLAPTREIHVATTGNDTTGNGSPAAPYRTIARATGLATPGTAVRIHPGNYPGGTYLSDLAGTAAAPIWIGGAPGEARPVVSGGGEGLHLTRVRHLVLHDLEVTGATGNGINCDDGGDYNNEDATRHVIFRGLRIHNIGTGGNQDALKLSGVNDSSFSTARSPTAAPAAAASTTSAAAAASSPATVSPAPAPTPSSPRAAAPPSRSAPTGSRSAARAPSTSAAAPATSSSVPPSLRLRPSTTRRATSVSSPTSSSDPTLRWPSSAPSTASR